MATLTFGKYAVNMAAADTNGELVWGISDISNFYSAVASIDPATATTNIISVTPYNVELSLADTQHTLTLSMAGNFISNTISVTSMDMTLENGISYSIGCNISMTQQQFLDGSDVSIKLTSITFKNELTGETYYSLSNINQTYTGNLDSSSTITADQYFNGNDRITGNTLNDILIGYAGNDTINGQSGRDSLSGLTGSDSLYGGSGNDTLNGGNGHDKLYGSLGKDIFLFDIVANTSTNADIVADFSKVQGDKIQLENSIFTHSDFQSVNLLANASSGTDIVYEQSTGKLYYDSDGAGIGKAAQLIATFTGKPVLSVSDITFV